MALIAFNETTPRTRWEKEDLDVGIRKTREDVALLAATIIEEEGPISEERICQLIGAYYDLSRVAANRKHDIITMITYIPDELDFAGRFYWPRSQDSSSYEDFRIREKSNSQATRKIHNVHPKELINCAVDALDRHECLLEETLMREVLKIISQTKLSGSARQYLEDTFEWGIRRGYLVKEQVGPNTLYRIG